jgi:hypothetical protein
VLKYSPIQAEAYEVVLYTFAPNGTRFFVGRIRCCECITVQLAQEAYTTYQKRGWLDEMATDLKRVNAAPAHFLKTPEPLNIFNVRFKLADVHLLDPFVQVPGDHIIYRINRYKPLIGEDKDIWAKILALQPSAAVKPFRFIAGKLKSTERRERAAQRGISYDPAHDRLQNSLFGYLERRYGTGNVGYEASGVDLVVKQGDQFIFL